MTGLSCRCVTTSPNIFATLPDGERVITVEPSNKKYWKDVNADDILEESFICGSSTMFRRALLPRFDPDFVDIGVGDRPILLLLALHGDAGFIGKPTTRYRVHGANSFRLWSLDGKAATAARTCFYVARHASGPFAGSCFEKATSPCIR